jgi:hypothetical protein
MVSVQFGEMSSQQKLPKIVASQFCPILPNLRQFFTFKNPTSQLCVAVEKEENREPLQTCTRPHLHREEIRRNDLRPMSTEKLLQCRFPMSFWCRLNAMALQNVRYSRACNAMPEIRECTLNSAVTPTLILFCHANDKTRKRD